MYARSQLNKKYQPRILHTGKISLKNDGEIKVFSGMQVPENSLPADLNCKKNERSPLSRRKMIQSVNMDAYKGMKNTGNGNYIS
jgi:hypothetical protein